MSLLLALGQLGRSSGQEHGLISSQFTLPKTMIEQFLREVGTSSCTVCALDSTAIGTRDASWIRYQCDSGKSRAIVTIGEHLELPRENVVTISMDIRRLWRLMRIYGDVVLVHAICRDALKCGGKRFGD